MSIIALKKRHRLQPVIFNKAPFIPFFDSLIISSSYFSLSLSLSLLFMSTFSDDPPLSTDSAHNYVTRGSINHPSIDRDSDFSFISDLRHENSSTFAGYQPPRPLSQPCVGSASPLSVGNERAIKSFELPTVMRKRAPDDDNNGSSSEVSGMVSPFTLPRVDASTSFSMDGRSSSSNHSRSNNSSIMDPREYPSETRLRIERSLSNIRSMSRTSSRQQHHRQHNESRDRKSKHEKEERFKSLTTSFDTRLKVSHDNIVFLGSTPHPCYNQAIEETMRQVNDDLNTTRTALEASKIVDQGGCVELV